MDVAAGKAKRLHWVVVAAAGGLVLLVVAAGVAGRRLLQRSQTLAATSTHEAESSAETARPYRDSQRPWPGHEPVRSAAAEADSTAAADTASPDPLVLPDGLPNRSLTSAQAARIE